MNPSTEIQRAVLSKGTTLMTVVVLLNPNDPMEAKFFPNEEVELWRPKPHKRAEKHYDIAYTSVPKIMNSYLWVDLNLALSNPTYPVAGSVNSLAPWVSGIDRQDLQQKLTRMSTEIARKNSMVSEVLQEDGGNGGADRDARRSRWSRGGRVGGRQGGRVGGRQDGIAEAPEIVLTADVPRSLHELSGLHMRDVGAQVEAVRTLLESGVDIAASDMDANTSCI